MRTTRTLAAATLFLLPLACSDDDAADDVTTDDPSTAVDGSPGGGENGLFVEIAFVGGFVPQNFAFRNLPSVVVYEDGTVIVPGATAAIFPGPAVIPPFTGQLEPDVLDDLLAAAAEAGMVGGAPAVGDADDLPVADAASTRVTVVVDGDERVVEAYALEMGAGLGQTGLSEGETAAREALAEFVTTVTDVAAPVADEPMTVERYRVEASPPLDPSTLDPAGPQPSVVDWPTTIDPPPDGACVAITGDDLAAFEEALAQANEPTQWTAGDRTFSLTVRVVLPHEPDCPAVGG